MALNISQFYANEIIHLDNFSYLSRFRAAKTQDASVQYFYKPNKMNYAWSETWVHWHLYNSPGIIYWAATPGMERWKMDQSLIRQRFKGISRPESSPSTSVVHSYRLNQPSFSALCCPTAQLLHGSPNSSVVAANDLTLPTVRSPMLLLHKRVLHCSMTRNFCSTSKHFICRKIPLLH